MFEIFEGQLFEEAGDAGGSGGSVDTGADLGGGGGGQELATIPTGGEVATQDGTEFDGGESTQEVSRFRPTDERGRLTKHAQEALAPLKQSSPALHKLFYRNQGIVNKLYGMVRPGVDPFAAWAADRQLIKDIGSRVENGNPASAIEALDEIAELDELYMKADPRAIDIMTSMPEGQASMVKLLPHVIARVENAPGGHAAILGLANKIDEVKNRLMPKAAVRDMWRTVLSGIKNNGVDLAIKRMATLIPKEDPIAAEAAIALNFLASLEAAAMSTDVEAMPAATVEVKNEGDPLAADRQKLANDQLRFRNEQWANASRADANALFDREWAAQTKGKNFTAKDKENITILFETRMNQVYKIRFPNLKEDRKSFFESGNREGFLTYMRDVRNRSYAKALKDTIVDYRPGSKPTAAGAAAAMPGQPRVAVDAGFRRTAKMPEPNHIDRRLTTAEMFKKGQAFIKPAYVSMYGGNRVQWAVTR